MGAGPTDVSVAGLSSQDAHPAGTATLDSNNMHPEPIALQPAQASQLPPAAASSEATTSHVKEEQPALAAGDPVRHQPRPHDGAGQVSAAGNGQVGTADVWAQDGLVSTLLTASVWPVKHARPERCGIEHVNMFCTALPVTDGNQRKEGSASASIHRRRRGQACSTALLWWLSMSETLAAGVHQDHALGSGRTSGRRAACLHALDGSPGH